MLIRPRVSPTLIFRCSLVILTFCPSCLLEKCEFSGVVALALTITPLWGSSEASNRINMTMVQQSQTINTLSATSATSLALSSKQDEITTITSLCFNGCHISRIFQLLSAKKMFLSDTLMRQIKCFTQTSHSHFWCKSDKSCSVATWSACLKTFSLALVPNCVWH